MKHLRQLLTWLLLVAVPLQGYAAGAMLFCGTAHGGSPLTAADRAAHDHAGHAHDVPAHAHGATAAVDEPAAAALPMADLAHGACSVCASCCSGVAMPAAPFVSSAAMERGTPSLPSDQSAPERAPARLERPPRFDLA